MKAPDLEFNYYYPFYTRMGSGMKKSYLSVQTVMHISDCCGIVITRRYHYGKILEIGIEMIYNTEKMRELRKEGKLIFYSEFASEIETVYKMLCVAQNKLSKAKPLVQEDWGTTYIKFKRFLYFEFGSDGLNVLYGNTYGITKDKKYQPIEKTQYEKELHECWGSFIEYFKCPTRINKTAYKPNN